MAQASLLLAMNLVLWGFLFRSCTTFSACFCLFLHVLCCVCRANLVVWQNYVLYHYPQPKDGAARNTMHIRHLQQGVAVYQECQTFDLKTSAAAQIKQREPEQALSSK